MSTTLTIRIDDALERELKRVAAATHRPKGDIAQKSRVRSFNIIFSTTFPIAHSFSEQSDI